MKWGTLLKDLKDKVGVAETTADLIAGEAISDPTTPPSSSQASPSSSFAALAQHDFNLLSPTRYFTFIMCTLTDQCWYK